MLVAIAALMLGAAYTSVLIVRRQSELAAVSRYNITWIVSQAGLEVSRLYGTVAASLVPGSQVDEEELDLRLAIVENRIKLLEGGDVAAFIAGSEELRQIVAGFAATVAEARKALGDTADPDRSRRLMRMTAALNPPIARLAAEANAYSADMEARDRGDLNRLHWLFAAILATIIALGLVLVGLMGWHNRLLARTREQARRQNAMLQARDAELRASTQHFDAALNNMSQALWMVDAAGRLIVCNVRFTDLFGLRPEEAGAGRTAQEVFAAIAARGVFPPAVTASLLARQLRSAQHRVSASFTTDDDDDARVIAVSQEPMPDGGWVATFEDITERRRTEATIRYLAHHDALTGLRNRPRFQSHLADALVRYHQEDGVEVALLCLDLDRFKQVNDQHGHPFGDQLLQRVATRLVRCVREDDVVARLGGDEFAILQVGPAQPDGGAITAQRIVQELSRPYEIEGQRIVIGASVGVARAAGDDVAADALMKNADIALYHAKSGGRGSYRQFEDEMGAQVRDRRDMEADLRDACIRGELRVFYQPLYHLESDQVGGFEALLRWEHPSKGMIPPAVFIPVAEETGLIAGIGRWVLEQACRDAASWPGRLKVAVNLSPIQFSTPGLVDMVRRTLESSGLDPGRLELEITESALLQNSNATLATLQGLRAMGPRLVLDDFGTGFSSLSYLHAFPFSKVKIDRSFVKDMTTQPHCEAIVRAVADLALRLGMTTTAEGVETREQLEAVRQAGCTEAQGYLIARPQPLAELNRWFLSRAVMQGSAPAGAIRLSPGG